MIEQFYIFIFMVDSTQIYTCDKISKYHTHILHK